MARSLKGSKFFSTDNNGVAAIVDPGVFENYWKRDRCYRTLTSSDYRTSTVPKVDAVKAIEQGLSHIPLTPVFTFVGEERFKRSPWFTGGPDLFHALLKHLSENGATVFPRSFYVPFSNGIELGMRGPESAAEELRFVTTNQQFLDTFGVWPSELGQLAG